MLLSTEKGIKPAVFNKFKIPFTVTCQCNAFQSSSLCCNQNVPNGEFDTFC